MLHLTAELLFYRLPDFITTLGWVALTTLGLSDPIYIASEYLTMNIAKPRWKKKGPIKEIKYSAIENAGAFLAVIFDSFV